MSARKHVDRLRRNDESRNHADHHAEEWSADELGLLFDEWGRSPLEDIAEVLGRTIEACRERYYKTRRAMDGQGRVHVVQTKKTTTTTTTEQHAHYIGASDDPDEAWWSPNYYKQER